MVTWIWRQLDSAQGRLSFVIISSENCARRTWPVNNNNNNKTLELSTDLDDTLLFVITAQSKEQRPRIMWNCIYNHFINCLKILQRDIEQQIKTSQQNQTEFGGRAISSHRYRVLQEVKCRLDHWQRQIKWHTIWWPVGTAFVITGYSFALWKPACDDESLSGEVKTHLLRKTMERLVKRNNNNRSKLYEVSWYWFEDSICSRHHRWPQRS